MRTHLLGNNGFQGAGPSGLTASHGLAADVRFRPFQRAPILPITAPSDAEIARALEARRPPMPAGKAASTGAEPDVSLDTASGVPFAGSR